MKTTHRLSESELTLIITDYFKRLNKTITLVRFYQDPSDGRSDTYTYADAEITEELKFDNPCSQR